MAYSESMAAVKAGTGTADDYSVIENHVRMVTAESIDHRRKASDASAIIEKHSALSKTLTDSGLNLDSDISAQLATLRGIPAQKDSEISGLRSTFEKKFADLEAKEKAATERARKKSAEADMIPAFSKVFPSGSVVYKSLVADGLVKYDENDQAFVTLDGVDYRGEALAIKLKDHPEYKGMALNTQTGGSGSSGNAGNNSKKISASDFKTLGPKEKAAFMDAGGTIS
jgi:hypothetical protein